MSILSYFRRRACRQRTALWPDKPPCRLEVRLSPASVNGLRFGSRMEEASQLGRPIDVSMGEGDDVWLGFWRHGLELEYERDCLAYAALLFRPGEDIPPNPKAEPARAALQWKGLTDLTGDLGPEDMLRLLGSPTTDDADDDERVLTHVVDGVTVETEFTASGSLKRLNLFPGS